MATVDTAARQDDNILRIVAGKVVLDRARLALAQVIIEHFCPRADACGLYQLQLLLVAFLLASARSVIAIGFCTSPQRITIACRPAPRSGTNEGTTGPVTAPRL